MKQLFFTRDGLVLVVLFLLVAGFAGFVAFRQREIQEQQATSVPYSSHTAGSNGTLALYEWLSRLGYRVERIENRQFEISAPARLLFLLGPTETLESDEARYILQWVARGNTLVFADARSFVQNPLLDELQADMDPLDSRFERAPLTQPLMDAATGEIDFYTFSGLEIEADNFVGYALAPDNKPILARIKHGDGLVWLSSAPEMFTNESLLREDNAKLANALFAHVPRDSVVAFDEYHLGFLPEQAAPFFEVLYDVPWGWAVLFTIILVFFYLALNGQRLGKVLPVPKSLARRSPSEYVTSMANLFRRADKRGMVLQHYRHSLKRRLGRPYHLNPELSDERYLEMLTRLRPELDRAELVRLLNSLRRTDTTETDLVKTIEQAVTFGKRAH
jgi:hypothetical protein